MGRSIGLRYVCITTVCPVAAGRCRSHCAARFPLPSCDLPAAWDHLRLVFARSMGPPGLPVTGPPAGSARLCGSSDPERSDRLSYREVSVVEVQEVLRAWLSGAGARPAAERAGVNVKTARRYIEAAVAAGLGRGGGEGQAGGFSGGRAGVTVRVDDGEPGGELQVDFGDLGMIPDQGRRRLLRALVFTAVFARYCFACLTFSQTTEEVIAGCEEAWIFFGGVFRVIVPDNLKPVVIRADAVNPVWNRSWLEYSQARGFYTDPARVRSPQDKGRVESGVKFVQVSFFAGEQFTDLADARARGLIWCTERAGQRIAAARGSPPDQD